MRRISRICGEVGTEFGTQYRKGSSKGIGKTYWTNLTFCVEEEKKGVSFKKVTIVDM